MHRGFLKNLVAFLLVSALTLGTVAVLSAATRLGPDAAAQYSQQVRREEPQVEELSAPVQKWDAFSVVESIGGFLLILAVAGGSGLLVLRGKRKGTVSHTGQAYRPRKDRARAARGRV